MEILGFTITKQEKVRETKSVKVWTVTWYSRWGNYHTDIHKEFVPFFNKKDAQDFAKSLEEAHKLLRNTNNIQLEILESKENQ